MTAYAAGGLLVAMVAVGMAIGYTLERARNWSEQAYACGYMVSVAQFEGVKGEDYRQKYEPPGCKNIREWMERK
jgi:hypothetical protein